MLTDERLNAMESYASDESARKYTLSMIVNELVNEYRTLKKRVDFWQKEQNKAMQTILILQEKLAVYEESLSIKGGSSNDS